MRFKHSQLHQYLQQPKGQLSIRSIRIGKVEFSDMVVQDRAGALHLQDLVQATYDHHESCDGFADPELAILSSLPLATWRGSFLKRSTTSSKTRSGRTFAPPQLMLIAARLISCTA